MLAFIAVLAISPIPQIARDAYGVPHVQGTSLDEAFYQAGYAVAQDRLWQMENSRRVARGKMAEAFGASFLASDREVLSFAYTDEELRSQLAQLSTPSRQMIAGYVRGVNAWITEARATNKLPEGYAKNQLEPEPWTELDTAAITIRLFQQFGKGGAGEIRNMALLAYLQSRAETKDRVLDILEDFAWFNDPAATTTIRDSSLSAGDRAKFNLPDRAVSARHISSLPKVSLLELLPGVRLAEQQTSRAVAESVSAPSKWGSYAIVVGLSRSATGYPLLLSAPQMGFRTPSVIHEMSISAPGYEAVGMDVPGVPGIAIGHTKTLAWGLTSGVADTDDIFYNPTEGAQYRENGVTHEFESKSFPLKVKGGADQTFVQRRTHSGPVVLESKTARVVFSRSSASRGQELKSLDSVILMAQAKDASAIQTALDHATVNFNCFYATSSGDIGYRYTGIVPARSPMIDPRFPALASGDNMWPGKLPMPRQENPKSGMFANWNNKPVAWWPNSDTPVWGRIFRNTELLAMLQAPKLTTSDLERAAWTIARRDETWPYFRPFVEKTWGGTRLQGFDGWMLDGSTQAQEYRFFLDALRDQLFLPITGNFVSPDNFRLIAQPSVMLKALEGKTKVDYLGSRKATDVVRKAIELASERISNSNAAARYTAPGIAVPGESPIPYSNRGTYIQIVELMKAGIEGRNVVTPGVAESGPNSMNQVDLARAWLYKPMKWGP